MGLITFEWTEQFGASQYQLDITLPSGNVESKIIEDSLYERWLESLPPGGEYSWVVIALDGDGVFICTAGPYSFTKPEYLMNNSDGDSVNSTAESKCPSGWNWSEIYQSCINVVDP